MRLKVQEYLIVPVNCMLRVIVHVLCNPIRFLIAFYCILMLILASGKKLLGLSKIVFVTRFAAKTVNNILSIIRMLEWFQFADRVVDSPSFLKGQTNVYGLEIFC